MLRFFAAALLLLGVVCIGQSQTLTGAGLNPAAGGSNCATIIAQVSGVIGCWNADEGVVKSGSAVTSWTDQSSSATVLGLNVSGSEPTPTSPTFGASSYGGKAGLTFTASSGNYLASTGAVAGWPGSTMLSVFMAATLTSNAAVFARGVSFVSAGHTDPSFPDSVAAILRNNNTQAIEAFLDGAAAGSYSITYSTASRFGVTINGATINTYLNNVSQASGSGGGSMNLGSTTPQVCVGDCNGGASAFWDGVIRRIVVTNTVVTSTDRSNIDTWLQQ